MNIWVEWFKQKETENNSWAQMKEQKKWEPPPLAEIYRRFFDKYEMAVEFAKRKSDEGYHASVKEDRST